MYSIIINALSHPIFVIPLRCLKSKPIISMLTISKVNATIND
jgi:hypothetical protein